MEDNTLDTFGPKPKIVNLGGTIEGFPTTPVLGDGGAVKTAKLPTPSVTDLFLQAAYAGDKPKGREAIPSANIYSGERYAAVRSGENLEEMYGQQQSSVDKFKNGAIKMAGTAAASFVAGTAGFLYGAGSAIKNGKFSNLYNNDVTRDMDKTFITGLEDVAPNYYTAKERDADWWSPDNIWTANFFSDKLIKNLGYTVGAIGGGVAWTKLLNVMGKTNTLVRAGRGLEAVTAAEEAMVAVPKVNQFAAFDGAVNSVAQKYLKTPVAKILSDPDRIIASTMGTFGEASLEALQNTNDFRQKAIEQYVQKYGKNPTGADLDEIDDYSNNVGNFTWGMNTLLLTGTNYIQLPKILGSSNRADKLLLNQIEKKGQGAAFTEVVPSTKFGKVLQRSKDVSKLFFAPTEAFEEGAQFAIQVGTNDYFNRAFRNRQGTQDFLTSLSGVMGNVLGKGVDDAISTKEGLESILIGGLSGGLQQARGTIREQGLLGTGGQRRANTDIALGALNQSNIENVLGDYARYIGIGIGSQKARQQAIVNNDKVSEKDFENDFTLSYIMPRVKYGKVGSVGEELSYYSQQSSTEEGFQELITNGIVNAGETREDFLKRLTNITRITKNIDDLYDSLGRKYGNQPGYTSEILDKMVYSLAKVGSYDLRIPEVNNLLFTAGVNTQDILQSIIKENKPNKEAVQESLKQINEMDVTSETKDDLKTALSDIIELGLRRKLFIDEYDAIKSKPTDFQFKPDVEFGATGEVPVTVIEEEEDVTSEGEFFPIQTERKLEVGKEYFLKQPVRKQDNTLTLAPKIKVLSQTLGGEYEVQLPRGDVRFLTPEDFATIDLADEGAASPELKDIMDAAIDNVLSTPEFAGVTLPEGEDKLVYINSLDNAQLIDAVETEFNTLSETYLKEQADLQANREKMNAVADKIKSAQTDIAATSGVVPTGNNDEDLMNTPSPKETPKKDASILFTSSTSASVDWEKVLAPNITRYNEFINKVKTFKNKKNIKAIVVTQKQEAALGLAGLGELSFREGNFDTALLNDPIYGFIGLVFVEDKKGERQFVDKNGNPIGKVGEQVELNKVVFTGMPAAKLDNSKGEPRNRAGQEEQAALELAAYEVYRKDLREAAEEEYPIFNFTPSRGIANTDDVKKSVGGVLIPENQIATQQVLTVVTKEGIDHIDGITYKFPNGRPVFQNQDTLEYLNNSNLTKDQASAVYNVLKAMSNEAKQQIAAKKPVKFNEIYKRFLQGVTFYTNADAVAKGVGEGSGNRIYIEGSILHIGSNTYDFANIEKQEIPIISDLQGVFHNVNSFTVNLGLGEPFIEFYVDAAGKLAQRSWKNYQSYLLASKNPDGSGRIAPLTTTVAKPTEAVPYTHKQKYIILNGLELPKQSVAKPAEAGVETYKSNVGAITYKVTTDSKGDFTVELVGENPNIQKIVDNPQLMAVATQQLKDLGKYDELDQPIETAAKFAVEFITAKLVKDRVEVAPVEEKAEQAEQPKNINIGDAEYRRIGRTDVDRISDAELALFKEWHAKNAKNIPYQVLENVIKINNTEKAWGAFENGVAKFFKGAQRGTEYHEIFEGIWKGFLSQGEQQSILDEFKAQTGSFLDRESGRRIDYANATDQQAKERIADDFAEFRLGKLPARNLTEKIKNFFKAIMDFFKSFVNKPTLKEDLFKAINTGEFADRTLPETVKNQAAEYRKIEGVNAKQTNEFVQDITARVFGEIFANNSSLFNIEDITAFDLFNRIREKYIQNNVIGDNPVTQISENQYAKLVERTKEFLKTYRIEFDEDSRVTVNDDGANRKDYAAEAFTVNFKKSSPYAVKLLIGTLIKTKGLSREADTSSIGGLKLLPFNQAFTTLMNRLSNTRSIPEFVSKLHELAKENSDYIRLFERLGGNLTTGKIDFNSYKPHDIRLFTNFYQVFTKQRPDALAMFMDGNNVYTAPANQASAIAATRSEWIENMKTKAEQPGSIISFNGKVYKVKKEDYNIKLPQDKIEFLAQLGIEFPMAVYNKVKNKKAFGDAVSGIKIGLSKTDELMSFGGRKLGIRTQLNELAKLYTVAASPAEDSTYFGVDGNRIQSDTDANYPSLLEYVFNSSDTLKELKQNMPQLNDVFSINSQVLKLGGNFFDKEGNRIAEIKLQYIQGVKDVVDNEGKTTSSLSIGDRYITEMNQNLDGRYYVLIPADSSREWMMNLGNTIAYTDVAAGNADKLFTDTFLGYLKDEIKLAQDSTNRAKLRNVGDKATELRFLKDMLPANLLKKINTLIEKRASEAEINNFIAKNRKDKEEQPGLDSSILKSLNDTVTKTRQNLVETQKVIASKQAGSFLMPELENRFTEKAGLNKLALADQDVNNVIKFANANYMINNVEFHKILFGDPYQFKIEGNQLDETKRIKSFLSPRRITVNSDEFNNLFNSEYNTVAGVQLTSEDYGYHEHKNFAKTFTAADVEVTDSFYPKTNEADAASWIMDGAFKEVKLKNGQWSDEAEVWHQWQMAYTRQNVPGYKYKSEALRKHDEALIEQSEPKNFIEELKPIVSGNKFGKTNFDLVLDKFSQMPLYYKAIKGTNLGKLYEKMFKEGYDYAVVVSGRKVGAEKLHKLYNEDGNFNEEAFNNTINVGWDAYGIQVENSYDKDSKQTLGSQLTKLATVDLYSDGKANNEAAKKAVEKNTEVLKEMLLNGYQELLRKLSIEDLGDNFVVKDKTVVADTLRQEMLKRKMSENGIDSISIDPEIGEFYIPFEASTNYIQIKSILYSIVDKSIVSPKVNGFPAVQVPVTMWEKAGESRGEGLKKSALKFYSKEDPYMEVYLPAWFKKQLPQGKTDEELIELLKDSEILKGIGFRIPTQGLNSAEVFRIKGFLPEFMGKTIVVPSEITTKAGSDFDIDKLNLYLKNIYVTPSGEIKSVPFFGYGDQAKEAIKKFIFEEDIKAMLDINSEISGSRIDDYGTLADKLYKQSLENEYFRSLETLLTLPDNFDRLTSPNTDTTLKEIAGNLDTLRGEDEGDIKNRLLDRNYMTNQRHAFLTGKRWIGIAAVNITGNSLAQKTDVFVENPQTEMALSHNKFKDGGFEHISLSGMKDQSEEPKYISDKLSMYANAFVDIAKDPYIMKIIYSNRVVGTFMLLERAGVPMKTVAMFMNQPIIREHIKNLDANGAPRYAISNADYIKQAKINFPASTKAIQAATVAEGNFEDNISSYAKDTMNETQNAEQHKILNEFLSYVTLADENFNFTQAINYDTSTFRNADDFYRKEMMTDRAQNKGAISSPQKVLDSSFLGTEKTVLDQSNSALGAILKFNQPEFRGVLENTIQQYAEKFYMAKDTFNRVAEKATASLLDYIIQTGRKNALNISELSFGPGSVAVKLEEDKQKYPNVQILQDLVVVSAERPNSPKTIKLKANTKEAYDENMYIGMMRELRDNPNTNQLFKDLIKVAIIQGTYQSAVSIKNIVPIEDYSTEVKDIVNTAVVDTNVQEFAKNNWFQRNNWKNPDITPAIAPYIDEESITELGEFKNEIVSQYKFTGFVEIPEVGIGENDKLVLSVGERSKAAGYDMITIPRIITTKYGEMIDFMTGKTITRAGYAELKAKGDPIIGQMFGYQKVKFISGEALRTYQGKFVFKMVNLYGDGQFISEYYKFNKPSELDNNTGKVTDEIPNSEIIKYFTGIVENEVNSQPETETDLSTKDFKCKF
jgi:hypothetical protein